MPSRPFPAPGLGSCSLCKGSVSLAGSPLPGTLFVTPLASPGRRTPSVAVPANATHMDGKCEFSLFVFKGRNMQKQKSDQILFVVAAMSSRLSWNSRLLGWPRLGHGRRDPLPAGWCWSFTTMMVALEEQGWTEQLS